MAEDQKTINKDLIREFFKRWPKLYYCIALVFGPIWFTGISPKKFLKEYNREGKKLNLGSGPKRLQSDVVNVDAFPYVGVDIVSDLTQLSFESESVGMIVCDNVLEHVPDAPTAVSEIFRVLKKGGVAYISTPFLYPFHSSPSDYHRWTHEGLKYLFRDFTIVELGVRGGAFSGLSVWLTYTSARMCSFGSQKMYTLFLNIWLLVFFPIKFLDTILNLFPFSLHTASVFYCIVEKRK